MLGRLSSTTRCISNAMSQKTLLSFFGKKSPVLVNNASSDASPSNRNGVLEPARDDDKESPPTEEKTNFVDEDSVGEETPSSLTKSVAVKRKRIIESDEDEKSNGTGETDEEDAGQSLITEMADSNAVETVKKDLSRANDGETKKPTCDSSSVKTLSQLANEKSRRAARKKSRKKPKAEENSNRETVRNAGASSENCQERVESPKESSSVLECKKNSSASSDGAVLTEPGVLAYSPQKENYHPISDAIWNRNESVPYIALAKTLQKIEETKSRLKIIDVLSNYFRSVLILSGDDLLPSIYLCLNKLGPAYDGQELGIAETYLTKAIAQCTGRTLSQIKSDIAEIGDIGVVAERSRSNQRIMFRPRPLTVSAVYKQLSEIASISGHSAIGKKIDKIQTLFVSCRDCEARFVIRSLAGKLRIGLAEQSVIQALALACTLTPPNQDYPPSILNSSKSVKEFKTNVEEDLTILKTVYSECPNYNLIVPVLREKGLKALPEFCKITPGTPVKPMLAKPTKGIQEVLRRFEGSKFTCEWKYDGERAQIHVLKRASIKIFSRNMEDNTSKYPDVISEFDRALTENVESCIIDAEAVAWDTNQEKIMPFQILSTRKRKGVNVDEIKVRVCLFFFDLLYLNGKSLIRKPLEERRDLLKLHFAQVPGKFSFVKYLDTNAMEEVEEFLDESIKGNCEGLMIKTLRDDASYEIAKRSLNWLKLKKDYLDGFGDTLDLVVIGGYLGKGKRTGQYGGFLLASYDSHNEEYQTICKIGTGFSDEDLVSLSELLKKHVISEAKSYYRHDSSHRPDCWFDAVQVWEVKCADLSLSPNYYSAIGLVDPEKGISLRFPRFLRTREDKSVEDATTSQQVAELYQRQEQVTVESVDGRFNEEDF